VSSSSPGPKTSGIPPQKEILKEEPVGDSPVFVPPYSPVTPSRQPNGQNNDQKQVRVSLTFSYKFFLEGVKKREVWHLLSEEDRAEKLAEAEARYDRYGSEGRRCLD
jgi:hypothetical protein